MYEVRQCEEWICMRLCVIYEVMCYVTINIHVYMYGM